MKILTLLLLLLSIDAQANDTKLIINGLSYHVTQESMSNRCAAAGGCIPFNQINYGIGVDEYFTEKFYYTTGVYKNSYSKLSTYIGAGYDFSKYSGVKLGAVTGYKQSLVLPMLMPYISIPVTDRIEFLFVMPFSPSEVQLIAAQLRISLPIF